MKVKAPARVFFVAGVSAEDEYEIVHKQLMRRFKRIRMPGDLIQRNYTHQPLPMSMDGVDMKYDAGSESVFNITMCILRIPLFQKLISTIGYVCSDIESLEIIYSTSKLLSALCRGNPVDVSGYVAESNKRSYSEIYSELLEAIHKELCFEYVFEEDSWISREKNSASECKKMYKDFSPIVDIFQGKMQQASPSNEEWRFEKICLSMEKWSSVQNALDMYLKEKKYKVTTLPKTLTVVFDTGCGNVNESTKQLIISKHVYIPVSILSRHDDNDYCYLKCYGNDGWNEYGRYHVKKQLPSEQMQGRSLMGIFTLQ